MSRSSVYETIEEEIAPSPSMSVASEKEDSTTRQPIFIVDSDTASIQGEEHVRDDGRGRRGIVGLRKFYALCDEAETMVLESKNLDRHSVLCFCSPVYVSFP